MMRVTSSTTYNGRTFAVELDEADLVPAHISTEAWAGLSTYDRHRCLMQMADTLQVTYMQEEGLISSDYAAQRLRSITARGKR